MKKTEIIAKMEELERRAFNLKMIDRWTWENREAYNKVMTEYHKLRKELEELA